MLLNQDRLRFSWFAIALFGLGLAGAWMVKVATPMGLGLINDSTAYIAGARSILQGSGYSQIWLATGLEPIIHYPPLLSAILALIGLSGLDPMRGVRVLNIALYAGNIWLMGIIGWRMTGIKLAGFLLALFLTLDAALLQVHSYAISEPLFIFLMLACILLLGLHFEKRSIGLLALAGVLTGLALLTRYVGLALLATAAFTLLVLNKDWRTRITSLSLYLVCAIPWLFAWLIRNRQLTGMETNRGFGWHPPSTDTIVLGVENLTDWLLPIVSNFIRTPFSILFLSLIVFALLCWTLYVGFRYFLKPASAPRPNQFAFLSAAFTLIYLGALIASLTMFDATTKLQHRILAPVYVSLTIFLVFVFVWFWKHGNRGVRIVLSGLAGLLLLFSAINEYQTINILMQDGQGYASARYQSSPIANLLRKLPAEMKIYTNSPPAVYSSIDRPCYVLFLDSNLTRETKGLYAQINQEVINGDAVLVFYGIRKSDVDIEAFNFLTNGLTLSIKNGTQMVYDNSP